MFEEETLFGDLPTFKYFLSNEDILNTFRDTFYQDIISSRAFQRLRTISFLGSIDYLFHPNDHPSWRRHTRHQHVLGVAALALRYARHKGLHQSEERQIVAAALLHDIGHAPLSHTLEPIFKNHFGIDHHSASQRIIMGAVSLGHDLVGVFGRYTVDVGKILSLLNGTSNSPHAMLFANPLNIDTFEAIPRCLTYLTSNHVHASPAVLLDAFLSQRRPESQTLDNFWHNKNTVYKYLVQGYIGVYGDLVCRIYMENSLNEFSRDDFFLDERQFRRKHHGLFKQLRKAQRVLYGLRRTAYIAPDDRDYRLNVRNFFIDVDKKLDSGAEQWERYRQNKQHQEVAVLNLARIQ